LRFDDRSNPTGDPEIFRLIPAAAEADGLVVCVDVDVVDVVDEGALVELVDDGELVLDVLALELAPPLTSLALLRM